MFKACFFGDFVPLGELMIKAVESDLVSVCPES